MRIKPDGVVVSGGPKEIPKPTTDGKRRLDDWIAAFLDYTDIVDCPINYLRWVALTTLAGAAQRKVYMDMEYFNVMSNLYVVLVGPPGTKKTTAIRQGRKMLHAVEGINLTSDAPSVPGLMEDFKEIPQKDHQSLNAFIYELSTLYENAQETMTGFLTAIYDGDIDYTKRTRIGGKETIKFPWFNLAAGTTPHWLGKNIGESEVEGGLVARTIYVYSDEIILKSARPRPTLRHLKLKEDLRHDLAHISQLNGQFDFEGGEQGPAFQWYDLWYQNKMHEADLILLEQGYKKPGSPATQARFPRMMDYRLAGYYMRKPIHLLKVAMAVSLSQKDELFLNLTDLLTALYLLEEVEPGMGKAFSAVGGNEYATDIERIHNQIKSGKDEGVWYSEIITANIHSMERRFIDDALASLNAMGETAFVQKERDLGNGQRIPERLYFDRIFLTNGKP